MPGIEGTVLGVALASVVETGLPNHGGGPVVLIPGKDHLKIERLLLPLADDGRTVDMISPTRTAASWSSRDSAP